LVQKPPVSYTDRVLVPGRVVPTKVTSFGTYSIKIVDPLLFYSEVCSKTGKNNITVSDMAEQYINEFLMAYTTALASLSQDMVLVTDIPHKDYGARPIYGRYTRQRVVIQERLFNT